MIRAAVLLLCLLTCLHLPGQNNPSEDVRLAAFNRYAERVEESITEKGIVINRGLDSLREMASLLDLPYSSGIVLRIAANKHLFEGNLEQATSKLSQARNIISSCCPYSEEMVNILLLENNLLINLGLVNFDTIHFKNGKEKLQQALIISRKLLDTTNVINCLDGLGDYYYYSAFQVENMDSSRHYYEELLRIGEGKTESLYKLGCSVCCNFPAPFFGQLTKCAHTS